MIASGSSINTQVELNNQLFSQNSNQPEGLVSAVSYQFIAKDATEFADKYTIFRVQSPEAQCSVKGMIWFFPHELSTHGVFCAA